MRCTAPIGACRADLERRQVSYVLTVATTHQMTTGGAVYPAGTIATGSRCRGNNR
jgi:hypothetical protein